MLSEYFYFFKKLAFLAARLYNNKK